MRHNEVILCGVLQDKPKIIKSETISVCDMRICTITGNRAGGLQLDKGSYDKPLIHTANIELIEKAEQFDVGDLIMVKGTLNTTMLTRNIVCSKCGNTDKFSALITYVNPASVNLIEKGCCLNSLGTFDVGKAKKVLLNYREISNVASAIGVVCCVPNLYRSDGTYKHRISSYQIAIKRKLRVTNELLISDVDFPWVKSYGKIAFNDAFYIQKGTYMFIDGWLRAREYSKEYMCSKCNNIAFIKLMSLELIPYACEYIKNYNENKMTDNDAKRIIHDRKTVSTEDDIDNLSDVSYEDKINILEDLKTLGKTVADDYCGNSEGQLPIT